MRSFYPTGTVFEVSIVQCIQMRSLLILAKYSFAVVRSEIFFRQKICMYKKKPFLTYVGNVIGFQVIKISKYSFCENSYSFYFLPTNILFHVILGKESHKKALFSFKLPYPILLKTFLSKYYGFRVIDSLVRSIGVVTAAELVTVFRILI